MIKKWIMAALISMTVGGLTMYADQQVKEYTLKNGLKVYLIVDPSSSLVAARTYVRAGSIDEAPLLGSGLSHYLEHLVAGGSTFVRSEDEYKDQIAHLGGAFNAYTTTDHTCYYINTTPVYTDEAIKMLDEWMFSNQFSAKEFDRERSVIMKEIEKSDASLGRKFYQLSLDNFSLVLNHDNHDPMLPMQLQHSYLDGEND